MIQFSLQTATTVTQSDRLIALGINPETADCFISRITETDDWSSENTYHSLFASWMNKESMLESMVKPAWSLSRMMDLIPENVEVNGKRGTLFMSRRKIFYYGFEEGNYVFLFGYSVCDNKDIFDVVINTIEHLIKIGQFNKAFLK